MPRKVLSALRSFTKAFVVVVIFLGITTVGMGQVRSSHCPSTDYDCQIAEVQSEIDAISPAHEYNKKELADLKSQIASLTGRISALEANLAVVENSIATRETDLAYTQEIFDTKTASHYKFLRLYDPLLPFLSSSTASTAFREIALRAKVADEDRSTIVEYVEELASLRDDRKNLEASKSSLASAKTGLDARATFLSGEVEKTESYLASLSAKQQAILDAKSGSFTASVGDSELADDYYASIKGFTEQAPSGSFAVFSFGAYTHRKGMSQYGARGRAENGQNYKQILAAYYGKEPVGKDTSGAISVSGYGNLDFEAYYLYGIAEMPSSWNKEALKAQAVAARTYAYNYKVQGKTICTNEQCQVFSNSKAASPPASWKQAVDETKGEIIDGVTTFYSSTAGGYLTTLGWDTTDGGGGSNFISKAWEKNGGSPWLYKAWYREGYTASGATCGKSNPWLTNAELADIVNAALVLQNKDDDRITPTTTSCWPGNPYSFDELKAQAAPYGGIGSVSSVYVTQGEGNTNQVVVNGTIYLSGTEFKQAFNLRAPGYLRIPQSGFAFFNIESK